MKEIVILGGGYAGVLTAKHLAKSVKRKREKEIRITLIDQNPYHTMMTELHEVACNRVCEDSVKMHYAKIFDERKVNVRQDRIKKIDFEAKKLSGENSRYYYDYLVLCPGSQPAYYGVEGAAEHAFSLWSFDDAILLREHILSMFRMAEREKDLQERKKMLTFVIAGGGFTGVEMAGELAEWVPFLCDEYHIPRGEVTLLLVDMISRILPSLPEKQAQKAHGRLVKMGVKIMLDTKAQEISKDAIRLEREKGIVLVETGTVVWTAGICAAQVIQDAVLSKKTAGRAEANVYLETANRQDVFVAGDGVYYVPEGEKAPVPQMVENGEASAKAVAHNLMASITGEAKRKYRPKFHGMMICVGGRWGTAYVGTHRKKIGLPSFFAMFAKHFINVVYFVQVLGWNKVFSYAVHEIFGVQNNRSFLGGHFSNHSPNFWSVPLRIYLGFSWLSEGLDKLPRILEDPTRIFLFTIPGAQDAVSMASPEEGMDALAGATPQQTASFGEALPVPGFLADFVNWMLEVFIEPIAPFFQAAMVAGEIMLGVLLLVGLFTAVASMGSAMMALMIYASGMAGASIIWHFVASISLIGIGGTGQVFALDYYLLPKLKKKWKKLKFVRRLYLYND